MLYFLVCTKEDGKTISYIYNKIYISKEQAFNALKTMIDSGELHESAKVFEMKAWEFAEVE